MLKVVGNESAQDETDGRSLLAREGARRMLLAALETEVAAYLEAHRDERDEDGHALVVRNGKGRTRKVTVGAGTIPVSAPRVNHRRTDQDGERRRFTSRILPPYMRRSPGRTSRSFTRRRSAADVGARGPLLDELRVGLEDPALLDGALQRLVVRRRERLVRRVERRERRGVEQRGRAED